GSDGLGYQLAQALGHSITERIFPALVPLNLPKSHFLCELKGITLPATLELWSGRQKRLNSFTNSTLLTHFGLSGPAVLDMSRYYLAAHADDAAVTLTINWLPALSADQFEQGLLGLGKKQPISLLRQYVPERMARALVAEAGIVDGQMSREQRKGLVRLATRYPLPISGNRGYNYAEVTAGGVPLTEIHLKTMESRLCPNLFFAGEICDVDGRIGGFNFQWAWSSGYVAGVSC
ncbi:MAG: aminoacetone oxidase family FAD-binding enzyme, partial [Sphaerospermopsis sp. SIO1G2]|nr:aminoacetone oxidase family FAD-binding enzyme [Sphaerospermopsis sp. SIO1G2]